MLRVGHANEHHSHDDMEQTECKVDSMDCGEAEALLAGTINGDIVEQEAA